MAQENRSWPGWSSRPAPQAGLSLPRRTRHGLLVRPGPPGTAPGQGFRLRPDVMACGTRRAQWLAKCCTELLWVRGALLGLNPGAVRAGHVHTAFWWPVAWLPWRASLPRPAYLQGQSFWGTVPVPGPSGSPASVLTARRLPRALGQVVPFLLHPGASMPGTQRPHGAACTTRSWGRETRGLSALRGGKLRAWEQGPALLAGVSLPKLKPPRDTCPDPPRPGGSKRRAKVRVLMRSRRRSARRCGRGTELSLTWLSLGT